VSPPKPATPTRPTSPARSAASPACRRPRCWPRAPGPRASRAERGRTSVLFKAARRRMREAPSMPDLDAAAQFVHSNGRLLERRRFEHLFVAPDPDGVLRAVEAYKNSDGGVGAMEPDLRTPASQPSAVLYALEA